MSDTTFQLVELAVRLIVGIMAVYVLPVVANAIKQMLAESAIGKAVLAAQQTLWEKSGEERKTFAMKIAREALDSMHISMSDDQISTLIEAAVRELRMAEGEE